MEFKKALGIDGRIGFDEYQALAQRTSANKTVMSKLENGLTQRKTVDFIEKNYTFSDIDYETGTVLVGTQGIDKDGYVYVSHKGKTLRAHQIIGYFLFGSRMVGKQINHIDGNKANNRFANLELVTASENAQHAFNTGLRKGTRGTNSSFTETDIVDIRRKRKEGATLNELATEYGVAFQTISRICNYDRWGHVPDDVDLVDMTFVKYQELAMFTANGNLTEREQVMNYALGLVSEGGEVGDIIKKEMFHGHEPNREKVKDELGDVLWYIANLARMYDITLHEIAIGNVKKLKKRFPDGFSAERSVNREE